MTHYKNRKEFKNDMLQPGRFTNYSYQAPFYRIASSVTSVNVCDQKLFPEGKTAD